MGGRHTLRGGADVVRYRVTVLNFVNGFPQFNVVSPATRNPADIGAQTFINTTLGNKKGIRIPGTPDNSHRNTRFVLRRRHLACTPQPDAQFRRALSV